MDDNKPNWKERRGKKFDRSRNQSSVDKNLQFLATEKLTEAEVGITEYVSPNLLGFSGIIKARYSDFHVNEINSSDEVAKLTDLEAPHDFCTTSKDIAENELDLFNSLIQEDVLKQLQDMVASDDDLQVELDAEKLTKEERCVIYEGIRSVFGKKIVANTVSVNDKKVMQFKKWKKDAGKVDDRRTWKWPSDKGEYVYFLVYKETLDTIEACFKIADCMKMNTSLFTYAGVKDRRAKTTQWFCVHKVDPHMLELKTKPVTRLHLGNFTFHTEPLKLGQLNGNIFKVALRNITADDDLISAAIESLKEKGFVNYFGLQRFGNDKEVPTYEIGVKLLLGKFKEACDLILKVKTSEDPGSEIAQAKRCYSETNNYKLASQKFKRLNNKCIESKLLLGFVKNNRNDYVNSLENIPRNMRLLYIHAFQSLVWNTLVSLRLKKFGLEPIEGDLVLLNDCDESSEDVKILTTDDLQQYSIYDVVLPLPGYDIKYPENELKESYKEILGNYGLTLEMPKQSVKTYTLSGTYRKIVCKAKGVAWKTIRYDQPDDTLIRSDYEELIGNKEPQDKPDGQYKALVVEFTLPPSAYATMVLREVLKMDTSANAHAKLNKYHSPVKSSKEASTSVEESSGTFSASDSLLSDAEKYEQFKRQVFGMEVGSEEESKRKLDESESSSSNKKIKM